MKSHLIIKLKEGAREIDAPHWAEIIADKSPVAEQIDPQIDQLLKSRNIPVWVTREYSPRMEIWSPDEIESGLNRVYRLILQRNDKIPAGIVASIRLLPHVESARASVIGVSGLPAVQAYQSNSLTDIESREAIFLPEAHRFTRGHNSIKIAVLDTGVSLAHPELKHALLPGFDFVDIINGADKFIGDHLGFDPVPKDEVGHGSHVTGILCGKGIGMPMGVVPECKIIPVRVLGAMRQGNKKVGAGLVDNINVAMKWAVDQGADVINMSLGVRHIDGEGLPHESVVDYAKRKGVSIIAASGNDGTQQVYYPGGHPYVITVGAADHSGEVAQFSTYGAHVDLIAPGADIYSSYLNQQYAFSSGTSHAAPFVSGAVAMLYAYAASKRKKILDRQAKFILQHSSDKIGTRFKDRKSGFGMLNLQDALQLLDHKLGRSNKNIVLNGKSYA